MSTIVIDFETYFDRDYTLKKIPTSEYVRSPLFKCFGAAMKIDRGPTCWRTYGELKRIFHQLDPSETTIVAHNAAFEGLILSNHFNFVPNRYICTIAMAKPLFGVNHKCDLDTLAQLNGDKPKDVDILDLKGVISPTTREWNKLRRRAVGDVTRTYRLFRRMLKDFPPSELDLIDTTIRMFADPKLLIDTKLVKKVQIEDENARKAAIAASGLDPSVLRSSDKFADALLSVDIVPPTKISPRTGKIAWAFAKTDLEFQAFRGDPKMAVYFDARLAAKTTQTTSKTMRMLKLGENGQRAPLMLNYCAAHTFRWGGGDRLNPQNIKRGSLLRKAITAPLGYEISVVDSSQIEARMNAWFAGQDDLIEQFRAKRDPYLAFARKVFPTREWTHDDEKDKKKFKDERFIGKVCVLALGYQMGVERLQATLAQGTMGPAVFLSFEECKKLVQVYRTSNAAIRQNWYDMQDMIPTMSHLAENEYQYECLVFQAGGVLMPNGLVMRYPNLQQVHQEWNYETVDPRTGIRRRSKIYGGLLTENIIQSLARIVIGEHINVISKRFPVVLTVHDEIVTLIPSKGAAEHQNWLEGVCRVTPDWCSDLPLDVEGGYDRVYSK